MAASDLKYARPATTTALVSGASGSMPIHVLDDGPGIPAEIRGRVFQPFVSRRVGGTGLGLAIVARIMEAHRGTVTLGERPGWTTCFTLTLPAAA
jgi:signal transduction histidine kinase